MNKFRIITFVILTTFVLSMPFSTISVDAQPPGQGSATMKTPGIIMKFCQNAATTLYSLFLFNKWLKNQKF